MHLLGDSDAVIAVTCSIYVGTGLRAAYHFLHELGDRYATAAYQSQSMLLCKRMFIATARSAAPCSHIIWDPSHETF